MIFFFCKAEGGIRDLIVTGVQTCALPILAMIFEKSSTRTRVSFDVGMRQLGGETIVLSGDDMQLGRGESIADTAKVLSRYVDAIMIRTNEHANLLEMAENASVPVINALTDDSHPCQIMADVMTFEEHRGAIAGRKLCWSGDGNNVSHSFIEAATRFGFELALATPETLDPDPRFTDWAAAQGGKITHTRDAAAAAADQAACFAVAVGKPGTGEQREGGNAVGELGGGYIDGRQTGGGLALFEGLGRRLLRRRGCVRAVAHGRRFIGEDFLGLV